MDYYGYCYTGCEAIKSDIRALSGIGIERSSEFWIVVNWFEIAAWENVCKYYCFLESYRIGMRFEKRKLIIIYWM